MDNNQEKVFYTYEKPNGEQIRITESRFKDKSYINFRTFFQREEGEFQPTKKGVTFLKEELDNIKEALNKIK